MAKQTSLIYSSMINSWRLSLWMHQTDSVPRLDAVICDYIEGQRILLPRRKISMRQARLCSRFANSESYLCKQLNSELLPGIGEIGLLGVNEQGGELSLDAVQG